jgi:hypothetical protein
MPKGSRGVPCSSCGYGLDRYSGRCKSCQPPVNHVEALHGGIEVLGAFANGCFHEDFFDFSNPGFPVE